jgi:cobalt-zinc-cadmium efflux system protein
MQHDHSHAHDHAGHSDAPGGRHGQGRHAHGHHHHHPVSVTGPAFAIGTILNMAFVVVEAAYGLVAHSMALLADAGHNLGDVLGLAAAWTALVLSRRQPSARYTYGLRSSSILAALLNAIILLIAVGAIIVEAIQHLMAPEPVAGLVIIIVAGVGVAINGATVFILMRGERSDLNVKGAIAHMLADTLVSVGVVVSGIVILLTGWAQIDAIVSLVVAAAIVVGTWRLLRQSLDLALHAVPEAIDPEKVNAFLLTTPGVEAIHDLHIWPMSTTDTALTCHLVMPDGHPGDDALDRLAHELQDRFAIEHVTVQVETGDPEHPCRLVPAHVI